MTKYRFLSLVWILPSYMLFLVFQQLTVHFGAQRTFNDGKSYLGEVIDFDIKQIAAQSNGYVVIRFKPDNEPEIERKLSLSIQMAQYLLDSPNVPVRYLKGAPQEIVLVPTYQIQKSTSLFNSSVAGIGLIATFLFAFFTQRFANKRLTLGEEKLVIERVDV
ncbi:MAG: hypothetical protein AAFW89_14055 [Bacteroidota bacterium]